MKTEPNIQKRDAIHHACVNIFHNFPDCHAAGLPLNEWCVFCRKFAEVSTGFEVKIIFHTDMAHDKIKSEAFVREKIGAIFDTHGVQEEIDYTLEVRRLYE